MGEEVAGILEIDFDRTSRHAILGQIVTQILPEGGSLLDIGGAEGLTAQFLPHHRIVALDLSPSGRIDVQASAAALPFPDGSFDAVSGLDLLEHVPIALRPALLSEATRVSRDLVVLAGPYDDAGVADTEARVQATFVELFGTPNVWLEEHADCGLPDFQACAVQLQELGLTVTSFGSNPLPLWESLQSANFMAARVGAQELHGRMNRQLFVELGELDALGPSYRRFLIGTRSGKRPTPVRPPSAGGSKSLESWLHLLGLHMAQLVNHGLQRFTRDAAEGARQSTEHARALERGWKESVERVRDLEERVREVEAASRRRLSKAEEDLTASEARAAVLERGWRQAAHHFDTVQRTMFQYEQALFRDMRDWHESVRGPEVTGEPTPLPDDSARYQDWIARRPEPPADAPGPTFSILTPVFNPDGRFLEACLRSVRAQTYRHWQHVLANVSTSPHVAPILRRFALIEDRITIVDGPNAGIAKNTGLAAQHAAGDWVVFMDHDDEIPPHALAAMAQVIDSDPSVDFIYSDEDKLDDGVRCDPFFKPGWSPDLLRMVNYIGHLVAVRRTLFDAAGGMRSGYDGAQDFDFLLRATALAQKVVHIPDVLYHWRRHALSTAVDVRVKPDAHGAGRRALQAFADEFAPGGWVDLGAGPTTHRLRYRLRPEKVSIIIPFRDGPELTDACLSSIAQHFNELPFEALLVSNRSIEEKTLALMDEWPRRYPWVRCVEYDEPFNFQALNNWAAGQVDGGLLLFLNNDTETLHASWIDGLAELAQQPGVGVVGPKLFYPDGLIQHAGVVVGIGGFADHPWQGLHPDTWTAAGPSYWVRNFLSVTAACLMVQRHKFEAVGGFDERFEVCGGDVDLGLRLHQAGYRNVMTPFVRLIHHESVTRDADPPLGDVTQSLRAYAPYLGGRDPYYNPNLTLAGRTASVASTDELLARLADREDGPVGD